MNGATHGQIVRGAIAFLFAGDDAAKLIVSSYYANRPHIMEQMDLSSKHVDYYQDLADSACGKDNIVIADNHPVTALNHYLFAFTDEGIWNAGSARCFGYAVRRTPTMPPGFRPDEDDRLCTAGMLGANVDYDNSLCLERVRPWFVGTNWSENWSCSVDETEYVPANIMAGMYYHAILKGNRLSVSHPGTQVSTGCLSVCFTSPVGDYLDLGGLRLFAPILHLIADMCVPHHVAGTNGCGHQTWEGAVQSDCNGKALGLYDFDVTKAIFDALRTDTFEISPTDPHGSQCAGMLSLEKLLLSIAKQTVSSLCATVSKVFDEGVAISKQDIIMAGIPFWFKYMQKQATHEAAEQRKHLFNLAVAASAFFLARAYSDMVKLNLIKATSIILPPPEFESEKEIKPEIQGKLPFATGTPWPIPGFQELIAQMNEVFDAHSISEIDVEAARRALKVEERFLLKKFIAGYQSQGKAYCPIGVDLHVAFPDMHHAAGLATFRLPSNEELADELKWTNYLNLLNNYSYKARLYQAVFYVAALRAFQQIQKTDKRLARVVDTLRNRVDEALRKKRW